MRPSCTPRPVIVCVIHAQRLEAPDRDAEILEVRHPRPRSPPYLVRWRPGHEAPVFPGPDATVQNFEQKVARGRRH